MSMSKWYEVGARFTKEFEDGTLQRVTEKFLINAESFTDVEARAYKEIGEKIKGEFFVRTVKKTDYEDVFDYKDESDLWFKVKITAVVEDSDSGKESKITSCYLVAAKDVKQAPTRIDEKLKGLMITYKIASVIEVPIVEVFPAVEINDFETEELK